MRSWCALSLLLLTACRATTTFTTPIPLDGSMRTDTPTEAALIRYEAAAAYSRDRDGLAVLVIEGDAIVYETYDNGNDGEIPHHIFSGTKTFACLLAASAIADGVLDLDELAADTLPQLADDPRKKKIRARHLLNFTSGLDQSFRNLTFDALKTPQRVESRYAYAMGLDMKSEPGAQFSYGSSHHAVFGALMKAKLGKDPLTYLQGKVLDPIGFRYAGWIRDANSDPTFAFGAWTTAREWAKVGYLLRDSGQFNDQPILQESALELCRQGSDAMPAYGLSMWLNAPVTHPEHLPDIRALDQRGGRLLLDRAPDDLFVAAGHNNNRLYVIPSMDLIIVRLGDGHRDYYDAEFLDLVLP